MVALRRPVQVLLDGMSDMSDMRRHTAIWYARIAIFLPLLVPACVYLLHVLGLVSPSLMFGGLLGSILVAGIPYATFAVVALVFLWNRPLVEYTRWSVRAPVIFIPVLVLFLAWSELLGRVRDLLEFCDLLLVTVPLVLLLGYAYVGLFYVGVRVVSGGPTKGVVSDASTPASATPAA